jgi:hypothetical protein
MISPDPNAGARFVHAFVEELGKWGVRLVIAAIAAATSRCLLLLH